MWYARILTIGLLLFNLQRPLYSSTPWPLVPRPLLLVESDEVGDSLGGGARWPAWGR